MALNEQGLGEAIRRFDQLVADDERLISIYYHPCEFATAEFWDAVNFKRGSDTPRERWKRSRLRAPGDMERDVQQLGRWIDHMLARQCIFRPEIGARQALATRIAVFMSPMPMSGPWPPGGARR
jgi:hypothetical protein